MSELPTTSTEMKPGPKTQICGSILHKRFTLSHSTITYWLSEAARTEPSFTVGSINGIIGGDADVKSGFSFQLSSLPVCV